MRQKLLLLLCALLAGVAVAVAQDIQVEGVVLAQDDGQPVMGASVRVVGSETLGRTTDLDGKFTITVPTGSVLRISYIGMKTVDVKARKTVRVVMENAQQDLDEVMVVAFGTAKKSSFTGSAAVVKSEDISRQQINNPLDALNGRAAGVQINNMSGQPGMSNPTILIRGISSINAGTDPLVIVDGAPFEGDFTTLNNQDIENMTVLKDAASAALYGARGANGVILITTKAAKRTGERDGSITVDAKWGCNSKATASYKTVDSPAAYYEMWYQGLNSYARNTLGYDVAQAAAFANQNLTANNNYGLGYNIYTVPEGEYMIGANGKLNPNAVLGRTYNYNGQLYTLLPDNWEDAIYNTSLRQEYTLTGTHTTERSSFFASVNFLDNQGITMGSDFRRLSARLNADSQIKPWLRLAGNVSYAHYRSNLLGSDGSTEDSGNIFSYTQMAPIYPVYVRDGVGQVMFDYASGIKSYDYGDGTINGQYRPYLPQSNPLSSNQLDLHRNEGNALTGTGIVELRFLKDFKLTATNTVNNDEARVNDTMNPFFGQYASMNGVASVTHVRQFSYNLSQVLSWSHSFGQHNVDAMVGHEYYRAKYSNVGGSKSNQFDPSNPEMAGAVVTGSVNSYTTDYNVEGWLARALYNYGERYFASASFRRDASSRFHPDNRWGNFWSLGGAWLISREKGFNIPWMNELKLKASYGEQGNDKIGSYRYTNTYTVSNSGNGVALLPQGVAGNKDITWEKNANFNVGLEFAFLKHRIAGSVEYFMRKTSDMLFQFPMTPSYGYTSKYANVGDMVNNGFELDLQAGLLRKRDLTWTARFNLTHYTNRITRLPDERKTMNVDGVQGYSSGTYYYGEGESLFTIYMPRYAGVNPYNGVALYYKDVTDERGEVVGQTVTEDYSQATYHLCGTALPEVYGGFGTTLRWKWLDVSVDFGYQIGGKVYDSTYAHQMAFSRGHAFHADLQDAWTPLNPFTSVPRLQFNDQYTAAVSDRFLTNASYLSLQNFNVGYTLPSRWTQKARIGSVRIYASGDNLWVWSKRQGLDPRQSVAGSNTAEGYAPVRTISGGITITL